MNVGLILPGPLEAPLPSTRVALLNVLQHLRTAGIETIVLHESSNATETPELDLAATAIAARGIQVVVFQKVYGRSAHALALALEVCGVQTVFMVCDRVVPDMASACSATVCVTEHLASLYPKELATKLHVVHDGIERPSMVKSTWRTDRGSIWRPLRAVLVTSSRFDHLPVLVSPPYWLRVDIVGLYPATNDWIGRVRGHWGAWQRNPMGRRKQIRLALHPRVSVHPWHPQTVYRFLTQADIGIIPVNRDPPANVGVPPPAWSVKSENRLTLKMSVGLPVVATPIPAYEPVVRQGENAFLAETRTAWLQALDDLRCPNRRMRMGHAARNSVIDRFSLERQAKRLIAVLYAVHSRRKI